MVSIRQQLVETVMNTSKCLRKDQTGIDSLERVYYIQPNKINMGVMFWYPVAKSEASVRCTVAYTGQVTFYTVPAIHGHVQQVDDTFPNNLQFL